MKEDFLDNLRKKDKTKRQRIAFTISLLISMLALGSWFMIWNDRFMIENTVTEKENHTASPLSSFKSSLDKMMESGIEQFGLVKNKFESQFESDLFKEVVDFENENLKNMKNNTASTSRQEDIEY